MGTLYVLFIFHRALAGLRNGAGYANHPDRAFAAGVATAFATLPLMYLARRYGADIPTAPEWFGGLMLCIGGCISIVCSYFCLTYQRATGTGFWADLRRDLHLWMLGEQGALALGLALGGGLPAGIALALAVYPSVFLQKAVINLCIGKGIFYNGTDDATGKTFGIPALGLRIPRTGQVFRLVMAVASIIIFSLIQK